ncbi:DUF2911 domain-containing protein [Aquimarina muelleri]|uniref:DUF2911 domain-containing protein n=1 Tax=Aquimarina muelleri TaxID=279356 RepID=A0A918JYG2_9FLAO|nr:DUF2911 domain-containing protein [Aquimarina muelleri]MCX2764430.1 DUF2911 domain-containing protein [Aquimarina muelleri]GGX21288.1 hypothetical protein GCM10007384_23140 [Aquimarina muelleri]
MKKSLLLMVVMFLGTLSSINAQKFAELQKSPTDISYAKKERAAKPKIKVIYSRPQKKGRKIFGNLAAFDKVWRTGADEATEIKFFEDVKMGDKSIKAGTYSLFTIPGEKEWTIIINSDLDSWGAYTYDEKKDVARIKVPVANGEELEVFSITFNKVDKGYHMIMGWDTTRIEVPFYL